MIDLDILLDIEIDTCLAVLSSHEVGLLWGLQGLEKCCFIRRTEKASIKPRQNTLTREAEIQGIKTEKQKVRSPAVLTHVFWGAPLSSLRPRPGEIRALAQPGIELGSKGRSND